LVSCVRRRVRVCAFLQIPKNPDQMSYVQEIADTLSSLGVHVTFREHVHEKLAVIDEHIFWDGSLNILSQSITSERMTRWSSREEAYSAILKHQLNGCETCLARRKPLTETAAASKDLKWIGANIATRRKEFGMTQTELSKTSGVPQPVISNIEAGTYAATMETMARISKVLRLEVRFIPTYCLPMVDELCDYQRLDQCRIEMDIVALDIAIESLNSVPAGELNEREYAQLLRLRSSLQNNQSMIISQRSGSSVRPMSSAQSQ
jgi:DNA-binding XRE family transcriptional regulator